jgi:hypothetical protein
MMRDMAAERFLSNLPIYLGSAGWLACAAGAIARSPARGSRGVGIAVAALWAISGVGSGRSDVLIVDVLKQYFKRCGTGPPTFAQCFNCSCSAARMLPTVLFLRIGAVWTECLAVAQMSFCCNMREFASRTAHSSGVMDESFLSAHIHDPESARASLTLAALLILVLDVSQDPAIGLASHLRISFWPHDRRCLHRGSLVIYHPASLCCRFARQSCRVAVTFCTAGRLSYHHIVKQLLDTFNM